jgi:O-succinylbenzoic acid--CoA ligase
LTATCKLTVPEWIEIAARSAPGKIALSFDERHWTWSALRASVVAAAATLEANLITPQGRIGILAANRPGIVFAIFAAPRIGRSFVPLNWRQTGSELRWQLEDAAIDLLLVDRDRLALADAATSARPTAILPIESLEKSPRQSGVSDESTRIDLASDAAIIYTSGTSGRPKGTRLTYGNIWHSAIASALHLGHRGDDIWLLSLPMFHIGGLSILFRAAIGAASVVLHERFDAERVVAAIDGGATLVSVVPTTLQAMLGARGQHGWPEHLRLVLVGGSAAPEALIEDSLRLGLPVAPTYGLTEAASQVATLLPADLPRKHGSSGVPLPLTELRIAVDERAAPDGVAGQVEIRGPTVSPGYLGALKDEHRGAESWFQTGDIGYLDEDGFLYLLDRRDDLIVSGGENIYPTEIERVLREHPLAVDAAVFARPHPTWGSRPAAAVVWAGDHAIAEQELELWCRQRLAAYKVPDEFRCVDELPRSPSGKLLRKLLQDRFNPEIVE